jgi:hypothetical protein
MMASSDNAVFYYLKPHVCQVLFLTRPPESISTSSSQRWAVGHAESKGSEDGGNLLTIIDLNTRTRGITIADHSKGHDRTSSPKWLMTLMVRLFPP